jgi:hypothetical protein
MTVFGPRLSLAPGFDQGSAAPPPGGGFQPGFGIRPSAFDHGLDRLRQLDHKPPIASSTANWAAASFRGETACLSPTAIEG